MQRMAQDQAELKEAITAGGVGANAQVGLSKEFEERLSSGFSEISRTFETVVAAYSTIVNRAMVQNALGGTEEGGIAPVAMPLAAGAALPEHERRPLQKPESEIDHDALRQKLFSAALARRNGGG